MLVTLRHVERAIRHQVEEREFHDRTPSTNARIFCAATRAFLDVRQMPALGNDFDAHVGHALLPHLGVGARA